MPSLSKAQKKVVAAKVMKTLIEAGIKIKSPYDVENFFEDNMTHEVMCPFFYDENDDEGKELNVMDEINKVLK